MKKRSLDIEAIVLLVSFVVLVVLNALFEIFRLGGVTAADVSNEVFVWFTPAGYVFVIWAVIYAGMALWLYRLARDLRHERRIARMPVGIETVLFVLSCVLNIVWLIAWHLRVFALTIPIVVALLAVMVLLYIATRKRSNNRWDWTPISLYASWLSFATAANIAHVVTRGAASDAGAIPVVSTFILLAVFVVVAFLARRIFDDYAFGVVLAWAGVGIGVHALGASLVAGIAIIVVAVLGTIVALVPLERFRRTA